MTDTASRPTPPLAGRRSAGRALARERETPRVEPDKGAWVEVASGPAQGTRGRVVERVGGNITIVTLLLGQRPLLLTVASAACMPLDAPPQRS